MMPSLSKLSNEAAATKINEYLLELKSTISENENEIKLLKEMIKSVKTMVRVKDHDISRYK